MKDTRLVDIKDIHRVKDTRLVDIKDTHRVKDTIRTVAAGHCNTVAKQDGRGCC